MHRSSLKLASLLGLLLCTPNAFAQDAAVRMDATVGREGGTSEAGTGSDASSEASNPAAMCPGAVMHQEGMVSFRRMGPVDFGPGTGMQMVGSRSTVGLEYNLLFSGRYDTGMRGRLNVDWPRSLTVTATGEPNGGYLDVTFGLRMVANVYVLGVAIPVPLSVIIDDNEGRGRSMFTPWAWNYEGTDVRINVSAWRDIYTYNLNIGGTEYPITLMARYNMLAQVKTLEIGFPDRMAPTDVSRYFGTITERMPQAIIPPPSDGRLELLTRWKPQLKYTGELVFRIVVRRRVCVGPICTNVDFMAPEFPVATTNESLPDPFDQMPMFSLPVQRVEQTEVNFGEVMVGSSGMQDLTIANPGASPLAVRISTPGDSSFTLGAMTACVQPGSSAAIPVSFRPTSTGTFQTELTIESNGTTGTPSRVTLYGIGTTTPTRPPARDAGMTADAATMTLADGAVVRGDGGRGEYNGALVEATCACRTPGGLPARSRGGLGAVCAVAAVGMLAQRARRRR